MIKVDVEEYCSDCTDFIPKKESVDFYAGGKLVNRPRVTRVNQFNFKYKFCPYCGSPL